jgi:hypothetical protein
MPKLHAAEKMEYFHNLVLGPSIYYADLFHRPKPMG